MATCASTIRQLGDSPEGNKLMIKYTGADKPDEVKVQGTADIQPVHGESGVWISGEKYTSRAVTVELKKGGVAAGECSYDLTGKLIPITLDPDAVISNFRLEVAGAQVAVKWHSDKEVLIDFYFLEGKIPGGVYGFIDMITPKGANQDYAYTHTPAALPFTYRLSVQFTDGGLKMLAEQATP